MKPFDIIVLSMMALFALLVLSADAGPVLQMQHTIPWNVSDNPPRNLAFSDKQNEIYVARLNAIGVIFVYDGTSYAFKRSIEVNGLTQNTLGMTSSDVSDFLYVSNWNTQSIYRISLTDNSDIFTWILPCDPQAVSVNSQDNLIVTCRSSEITASLLVEYTSDGEKVREIPILDGITTAVHAIQLANDQFVVSYPSNNSVYIVGADGHIVARYGNNTAGSAEGQLNYPTYLAIDDDGFIYVSDSVNNRIVVLDSKLQASRVLPEAASYPAGLSISDVSNRLFIGETGDVQGILIIDL